MVRLSASSIKSFESCSWIYYCEKVLKIPQKTHPKTKAGSIAHEFFEILSNKKRKGYVENILNGKVKNIYSYASLDKLLDKLLKKYNLPKDPWREDVNQLVLAGLKLDFYQEENIFRFDPEYEFWIKTDKYEVHGFIDQAAKMKNGRIVVRDYKSQGFEFTPEEMEFNIQALLYQYALNEQTGLDVDVEFIMLRHNKKQVVKWQGKDNLDGLKCYLDYVADFFEGFDLEKASSNFAAHDKNKWYKLGCITKKGQIKKNGEPYHCCQYKFPRKIYYIKDEDSDKIKYVVDDILDINLKDGETFEEFNYLGCRYWFPESYE